MAEEAHEIALRDICHARSGDKGNSANVGVICFDPADYEWLAERLTADAVGTYLGTRIRGKVERWELPNIGALNFLLHEALDGGASRSLSLDIHGKGYSSVILSMTLKSDTLPPSLAKRDLKQAAE